MRKTLIIIFTILLSGCGKLSDGIVNYVDFPDHPPRIAATLIVNQDSDVITALIASTASVDDTSGSQYISDAVLTISDETGAILYSLSSDNFQDSLYILNLPSGVNIPNGEISLEVDAPELDNVSAMTIMPSAPIVDIEFFPNADTVSAIWGEYVRHRFDFDFQNNVSVSETFMVRINIRYIDLLTGEVTTEENLWLEAYPDPRVSEYNELSGIVISDESVSSNSQGLQDISLFGTGFGKQGSFEIYSLSCTIESLSPSLAKHYESVEQYYDSQYSLFSEPNLMYSNVSSGFGCFGMSNSITIEIE